MTSILEELWGKVQEFQKDFLEKHIQPSKSTKVERQTVPERRSKRRKRLGKKDSTQVLLQENAFKLQCIDDFYCESISMERETERSDSVASVSGGDVCSSEVTSTENLSEGTLKQGSDIIDELNSSTDASTSNNNTSSSSNTDSSVDDNKDCQSTSEKEGSENTSDNSASVSHDTSKSEHTDSFQTSQASTSHDDTYATASEPDSSAALGILNQLSEELCCLNRDGASLATSRHDTKKTKLVKTKKSSAVTPSKIKFNFKTPTKSPSRLSSSPSSANKLGFSRSPSKSPFRYGYKTPTRPGQKLRIAHSGQSQKRKSVKRKVLDDSGSPKRKKVKAEKRKRKKQQTKQPNKRVRTSDGPGSGSSSNGEDGSGQSKIKKTGWTSSECDSSSEEENALQIMSESEEEADEVLDEKRSSAPLKLTVKNVRSLLKAVIGNEHVQDMLRNTLQEDGLGDALKEAIFEPKMTRSKVKQVMEQEGGQILHHMSPLKCLKAPKREPSPTILDINFNEDEEEGDEEYEPTADDINQMVSDDETETGSVTSSQASDFGSPMVSTPLTPRFMTPRTPLDESTPKSIHPLSDRQTLTQKARCVRDITKCDELNLSAASIEEEELIAKRTRSKLPMKDTLLEELEANFVAPDITPDMYDTTCDDPDWKHFLGSLVTSKEMNDTNDDEASDPEFNFLDELENEQKDLVDQEEVRWHRAVKISKKELHSLMDELFEAYNSGEPEMEADEWNRRQDDQKKPKQQEKEKKTKKVEVGTAEKKISTNTNTEASVTATSEPARDDVAERTEQPTKPITPQKEMTTEETVPEAPENVPEPVVEKILSTEEESSSDGSSDPNEEFQPYVPPLKFEPKHAAMLVRDLVLKKDGLRKTYQQKSRSENQTEPEQFTENERAQLEDQMRKYVQLCTQMFVLTVDDSGLEEVANTQKTYINELKALGDRTSLLSGQRSAFHPCNITGSLDIVSRNSCCTEKEVGLLREKMGKKNVRKGYMDLVTMSDSQMEIFATSKVFLFPQMLPEGLFFSNDINDKRKCLWLPSEDNLLAMGVDQVGHLRAGQCEEWVGKLLVPTKTKAQIGARMKNLRSTKAPPNPIKHLKEHKKLPEFPRYSELENEEDIVAPQDRDRSVLPSWFKAYEAKQEEVKQKTTPNKLGKQGVLIQIKPGSEISSPKAIELPENMTSTPTGPVPLPRVNSPALTPVQFIRSTVKLRQEKPDSPKSSAFILPKSAFVPVGNSAVQVTSGAPINSPVIGIAQVVKAERAAAQTAEGRTSPVVVVAPNQLQSFGAQIIMLPSPTLSVSPGQVSVDCSKVKKDKVIENKRDVSSTRKETVNTDAVTISLPETSDCSPEGEALLDKLDMMDNNVGEDQAARENVDLHELTAYLTTGQNESVASATTSNSTENQDSVVTVISSQGAIMSIQCENTVSGALGFNPISPGQPNCLDDGKGDHCNQAAPEVENEQTEESLDMQQKISNENTSRPNSRGAAPSPGLKRNTGFVQLGEHTRDSPNIFVSINNSMYPTGKKGTILTVTSRMGEISEARCSPLPEGLMRGISPVVMSAGGDSRILNEAPSAESVRLIKDILTSDSDETPKEGHDRKRKNPLLDEDTSLESKTTAILNESAELHLEAPEVPTVTETPRKNSDILCTPVKMLPSERPGTYTSPMYTSSPPVVVTPPANTPTKAAVEIMAAIAQIITTPNKTRSPTKTPTKSSPPPITMVIKTPPSKKNLMSIMSPGKSFSNLLKSPILMQPLPSVPDTPEAHRTEGTGGSLTPEKRGATGSPSTPSRFRKTIPSSPLVRSDKKSPRRQILQQKARAIMPKGYIPTLVSPVKMAAATITAKAKKGILSGSPVKGSHVRKILPKPIGVFTSPPKVTFLLSPRKRKRRTRTRSKNRKSALGTRRDGQPMETEAASDMEDQVHDDRMDAHSGCETMESEFCSDENDEKENDPESAKVKKVKHKRKRKVKARARSRYKAEAEKLSASDEDVGDADGESDDVPTDDDEEHLADLMAAATTINFDSRRQSSPTDEKRKGTAQVLRDKTLQMLAPDLIEKDPLRDERDTAFAKAFLNRTQEELKHDRERYVEVISLINQLKEESPVMIFKRMEELLKDYEELIKEFAGFLSPEQAMACGHLMDQQEFNKARLFLRKLEVFFRKHPNYWQKILKMFTTHWRNRAQPTANELKGMITPMLRGQKHLLEEFSTFFENERPPESYMTDFEEVTLPDSDDDGSLQALVDEVEEIYLPDDTKDLNGTRKCRCHCHKNVKSKLYATRKRHCNTCALKIINGRLYLQTTEKHLRPVHIVYKIPPKKKREPTPPPEVISEEEDEAEVASSSSEESNSSSDGGDREKIGVVSEEEEDGQSEGAESEGGDSDGVQPENKEQEGNVSSGEESVVNGEVNSENDETSKGSEDKGGATSCTDVESVNLNTEGSNTASAAYSVGTLSEDSVISDVAKGSDCSSMAADVAAKSPRQPTDFSEFTEEIRKARESADDHDSLDGLARELENRMAKDIPSERHEAFSTASSNRSASNLEQFPSDNLNTSTETLKGKESGESSSDCDEVLHQTDGSNDSYCVRKHSLSRQMTVTTETVSTITKYSEESISSPFKHLSRTRNNRSGSSAEIVNSSLSRSSAGSNSQSSFVDNTELRRKDSDFKQYGASGNSENMSNSRSEGSQSQSSTIGTNGAMDLGNSSSSLSTSSDTQPKHTVDNALTVCEDTMMETERFRVAKKSVDNEDQHLVKASEPHETEKPWSREDDQLLLLTCKQHGVGSETWRKISELLPGRSGEEIKSRYHILMEKLRSWVQSKTPQRDARSSSEDSEYETSDSDTDEET